MTTRADCLPASICVRQLKYYGTLIQIGNPKQNIFKLSEILSVEEALYRQSSAYATISPHDVLINRRYTEKVESW